MKKVKPVKTIPVKYKFDVYQVDWEIIHGKIPTRTFEIGEMVKYGTHDFAQVEEIFYYKGIPSNYGIKIWGNRMVYGVPTDYQEYQVVNWYRIEKHKVNTCDTIFAQEEKFRIRYSNTYIEGLISKVLSPSAGVNFTPEYQRDYVWSEHDKEMLIDSIFNNISIGAISFVQTGYVADTEAYEILDGKQRLSTLVDFFQDRLMYRGYLFSDLHKKDQNHFLTFGVSFGTMDKPSEKEKLAAFISLNTTGKVMDANHLKNIIDRYNQMD